MSDDKISVYVNGTEVRVHRGSKVKHALIAFDQKVYESAEAGDLFVRDGNGFDVGLDGGVREGSKLFTGKPDD